ncbi:hypothetical protein [Helicobacter heilmannii]|uniref:hypothetical protein n=1 Tax=Helicobacter heilmannii TaxID=35817 RepID=UPI00223931E1|nr:hypothetical protein [Helicobacter heilmannii]
MPTLWVHLGHFCCWELRGVAQAGQWVGFLKNLAHLEQKLGLFLSRRALLQTGQILRA